MKISINLASQPFRRDRPMVVASITVGLLLLGTLGALITLARADNEQLADIRKEVGGLRSQVAGLTKQEHDAEAVLRQPQNAEVLETSVFLNKLLYRKGISWTRILADLEKVMPPNMKVLNIRPQVNGDGQITLDMIVGSEGPKAVIPLYQNLENSPLFSGLTQPQYTPPSQSDPLYRYRLTVNYVQKL
jgi:type IV pilus assembly protein PilN